MATAQPQQRLPARPSTSTAKSEKKTKLPKLPSNTTVSKRPLHHAAIPSPYAGASQQKVVYVGTRTPFLSAVKRVEKLLRLSDKRLVQSATTLARQKGQNGRKRKRQDDDATDEIGDIARQVESAKAKRKVGGMTAGDDEVEGAGEEVLLKGTGKAISRVMEMGCWFQQRQEYMVTVRTGSVAAVDDIDVPEGATGDDKDRDHAESRTGNNDDDMEVDEEGGAANVPPSESDMAKKPGGRVRQQHAAAQDEPIPETRVRYLSVLEVAVSLR
ncbi:hypothetical protein KC340_g14050 [Hortaea werneckii]|nr:hypothetical protein KC342_g14366 [Hortaea werneckii]KAI7067060.1 hypothetical protein KC339_g15375 [Hortaea werneckii]KAI7221206.1 hypothetical protein KC365_g11774 [Hortaea werneckii]KAI7298978.1 hypothetical protein KC340_g14050 [Hortaea werneckii]KAI7385777.1 hypothetical protein KC328_g10165 [Hortaea werneckii]